MVDNIGSNRLTCSDKEEIIRGLRYPTHGGAAASSADHYGGGDQGTIKELQDHLLPIANVGRIMKRVLPANAKMSKEAKETMQECVSEFISFVTGEASDKCHKERRKTVNGDDICWALGSLGFDDFSEALRRYLVRYREAEGERAAAKAGPAANEEAGIDGGDEMGGSAVGTAARDHAAPNKAFSFDLMDKRRYN